MKNKYVFILCPHYQGFTIILNLLNSSNKVSSFSHINKLGEGTNLFPRVGIHNFNIWENGYDPNYFLDLKKGTSALYFLAIFAYLYESVLTTILSINLHFFA